MLITETNSFGVAYTSCGGGLDSLCKQRIATTSIQLDLHQCLSALIENNKRRLEDVTTGAVRAFELAAHLLPTYLVSQLNTSDLSSPLREPLKQDLVTHLQNFKFDESLIYAFFQQIESKPVESLRILRHSLSLRDDDISPDINTDRVLLDPSLPRQLMESILLGPALSGLLKEQKAAAVLSFESNGGDTILPLLAHARAATLLDKAPAKFAALARSVNLIYGDKPDPRIDYANLSLSEASKYLSGRRGVYHLALLPHIGLWNDVDLSTIHIPLISHLIAPGGVMVLPSYIFGVGRSPAANETLNTINKSLLDHGFKLETSELRLDIIAPIVSDAQTLKAFADLEYYGRLFEVRNDSIPHQKEVRGCDLARYRGTDSSHVLPMTLQLNLFRCDSQETKEGSGPASPVQWIFRDFTNSFNSEEQGEVVTAQAPVTNELFSIFGTESAALPPPDALKPFTPVWPEDKALNALLQKKPDFKSIESLRNPELWEGFYNAEASLWRSLLSLWPVQLELLKLITSESQNFYEHLKSLPHQVSNNGTEVTAINHASNLWGPLKDDCKKLLSQTNLLINKVAESTEANGQRNEALKALYAQMSITREYLEKLRMPYDYRQGEYNRLMDLIPEDKDDLSALKRHLVRLYQHSELLRRSIARKNKNLIGKAISQMSTNVDENSKQRLKQAKGAGFQGLLRAVELYDGTRGAFSTYAFKWIKSKLQRDEAGSESVKRQRQFAEAIAREVQKEQRSLTTEERESVLAKTYQDSTTAQRLIREYRAKRSIKGPISLNAPRGNDSDYSLLDQVPQQHSDTRYKNLQTVQVLLKEWFRALPNGRREICECRFLVGQTLEEIAKAREVTKEAIRQTVNSSLGLISQDSNPAYGYIRKLSDWTAEEQAASLKEHSYVSEIVEDKEVVFKLLRYGIFTISQLKLYSPNELELLPSHLNIIKKSLSERNLTLAKKMKTYETSEITRSNLSQLPTPTRAKILMSALLERGGLDEQYVSKLYNHWISVIPDKYKQIATTYFPTAKDEGLYSGRPFSSKPSQIKPKLLQVLTTLGHSDCPTAAPIYDWLENFEMPRLRSTEGFISNIAAGDPDVILQLTSGGVFFTKDLVRLSSLRRDSFPDITKAQFDALLPK